MNIFRKAITTQNFYVNNVVGSGPEIFTLRGNKNGKF